MTCQSLVAGEDGGLSCCKAAARKARNHEHARAKDEDISCLDDNEWRIYNAASGVINESLRRERVVHITNGAVNLGDFKKLPDFPVYAEGPKMSYFLEIEK